MKVVYVAGPYAAPTHWGIEQNIQKARLVAAEVWAAGAACICPHAMTAHMSGCCPEEYFYEGDLEILRRCDAVLLIEGWENSTGSKREKTEAEKQGIPVFTSIEELREWLDPAPCGEVLNERVYVIEKASPPMPPRSVAFLAPPAVPYTKYVEGSLELYRVYTVRDPTAWPDDSKALSHRLAEGVAFNWDPSDGQINLIESLPQGEWLEANYIVER